MPLVFLLLLLCVSPAFAETLHLDPLIVTANRYEQDSVDVASAVTIISSDQIQRSGSATVADILSNHIGVHVTDNGSLKTKSVDLRGFGDGATRNVLVMVDSRRINPVDNSGPDLLQIPLEAVERIEIIRGASSVLYGDNALGGVINIITKKGHEGFGVKTSATYGSYDSLSTSQSVRGGKGKLSYALTTSQFRTDGYRANSQLRARDYVGRFGYQPADALHLDFNTNWHEDRYGLPGGLKDADLHRLGRRGTTNPEDFASTKDRSFGLTAELSPWGDEDAGRFVLDGSLRNRDTYAVFYSFGEYATKRNINSHTINGKYVMSRQVAQKKLNLVAGVDHVVDDSWIYGSAGNSDDLTITKADTGYYANGSYEIVENLHVETGTRYDRVEYTFNQKSGSPTYQKQRPDAFVSMGGLRFEYAPESNAFVNVQQTFRFLTTDDWFDTYNGLNTSLKQQKGIQYQAGVKHKVNDVLKVSATPYLLLQDNEIFLDPSGGGGFGATGNYDKTRRMGIELEQTADLKSFFNLPLSKTVLAVHYTQSKAVFLKGPLKGNDVPMAPQSLLGASLDAGLTENIAILLQGNYTGAQYAINDVGNVLPKTDPYCVLDARLTYEKGPLSVFAGVDNLLNERYDMYVSKAITSSVKSHFPAQGRSYHAGVKVSF